MKSLRKDKNIRRALLCQRLLSAAAVLQYYEAYFRFVDCATLAKIGGISYSKAEELSNRKMDTRLFRKALRDIDVVFNETIKKVTKRILKWEKV